jgi:hypothetical protein
VSAVAIGPFVRFAIMASSAVYANWDTIRSQFDRAVENEVRPIYGYYVQHIWQQKDSGGAFTDKERAMVGVHWMNTTGGDLDVTWTSADFALVEAGFQAYWTSLGSMIQDECRLVEHRWYSYGPGVVKPNPPARITTIATPLQGTGTAKAPHQIASTLTLRTPLRRHWGRIYMPVFAVAASASAGGQLTAGAVDLLATGGSTYIKSGLANGLTPCVWDRNRHVALGVTSVESDSVPDIIRRRRSRVTAYRKILTA